MLQQFLGKYRGEVVDINDPLFQGSIRVKCPAVLGVGNISGWALPCFPPNTFALPQVGDLVWVEFEGGDRNLPIWSGVWYTSKGLNTKFGNMYTNGRTAVTQFACNRIEFNKTKMALVGYHTSGSDPQGGTVNSVIKES